MNKIKPASCFTSLNCGIESPFGREVKIFIIDWNVKPPWAWGTGQVIVLLLY